MSKIIAQTLSDGLNDVAVDTVFNGSVKAWANLRGSGSSPALRDDFNMSSVTDFSTGIYAFNLVSAMADTNYAVAQASATGPGPACPDLNFSLVTTMSYGIRNYRSNNEIPFDGQIIGTLLVGSLAA